MKEGQVVCVESRIKAEPVVGAGDGYFQAWLDDIQVAEYPNIGAISHPAFTGQQARFNDYLISSYWNCQCDPASFQCNNNASACIDPQNAHPLMQRLVDRIVISRARIGCSGTGSGNSTAIAPAPPGQVQAK